MEAWAPRRARSIPGAAGDLRHRAFRGEPRGGGAAQPRTGDRAARSLRGASRWRRDMKYQGGCHCGNLRIEFETALSPAEIELRACPCTFCRKHGSRAVAAVKTGEGRPWGIAIVNVLDKHRKFPSERIAVDYDAESRDDRMQRRRQRWTPVTMALPQSPAPAPAA